MIFIIIQAIILAIIIGLIVQYIRVNARAVSKTEFEQAAERRARRLRHVDPVITCDYCGAKFDTSKYQVCPNCGAPYAKDAEWLRRHDPNLQWADRAAKEEYDRKLAQARVDSARILKRLRRAIAAVVVMDLALVGVIGIGRYLGSQGTFQKDEKVNKYNSDHFVKTTYGLSGDPVVLDKGGLRVTVLGFYAEPVTSSAKTQDLNASLPDGKYQLIQSDRELKVALKVENRGKTARRLTIDVDAINGIGVNESLVSYSQFRPGKTVIFYTRLYHVRGGVVKDMVLGDTMVRDSKSYDTLYSSKEETRLSTTAKYSYDLPEAPKAGKLVYEKGDIQIYAVKYRVWKNADPKRELWIYNRSDERYAIRSGEAKAGGQTIDTDLETETSDRLLPAHSMLLLSRVYPYLKDDGAQKYDAKDIRAAFTFSALEDPARSFTTPYIRINDYSAVSETAVENEETDRSAGSAADASGAAADAGGSAAATV